MCSGVRFKILRKPSKTREILRFEFSNLTNMLDERGINEDSMTDASHSVLAKYWSEKLNKKKMSVYQLSSRGGFLELQIIDSGKLEMRSNAQMVFEGVINV